jgi:DNA-binding response OmpR family regulator
LNIDNSTKTGKKNTGTILVLDDELDITGLIKISLEKQGYQVFGFTDPLLALEHFQLNPLMYDLVLSDLRMPGMSGFQFLNKIKLTKPQIKVILMSAFDMTDDFDFSTYSKSYEIDGYIQKPISIRKLNGLIKSYMTSK